MVDDLAIESGFVNRPAHHYLFEEASGATAYDLPGTVDGTLAAGASLRLGSSAIAPDFGGSTTGAFDDVRIYSSALRDCDIALIAARP